MADNNSQDDFIDNDEWVQEWLTTPEGWAAQSEVWTRQSLIDELIYRDVDSAAEEMLDHMPADYGRVNTQLMLI